MINALYRLICSSDLYPTKFMLGVASISLGVSSLIMHGFDFYTILLVYGFLVLWRVFDFTKREGISVSIATLGAIEWTYIALSATYNFNPWVYNTVYSELGLISSIVFSMASLWLLFRSDSDKLINMLYHNRRKSDLKA